MVNKILHVISVIGTFMMIFGIVYLVQAYTIGLLPFLNKTVILDTVPINFIIFSATTLIFMKKIIRISSPYKE